MANAMHDLLLPLIWIITKAFHNKLFIKLVLGINELRFILLKCITIIALDTVIILMSP